MTFGKAQSRAGRFLAHHKTDPLGFDEIVRLIITSSWIDLAIFGASAIALGSIVDRHGIAIKLRLVKWFDAVGEQTGQVSLQN